jgi:protein-L-isoaspartate(D-aspartate) O-methyltransferase
MIYHKKLESMIGHLRKKGITDEQVLKAMERVPRHLFVPAGLEFQAYEEKALPICSGQTISHPYTVALMTQTLQVQKGQKILELGTGSGYQAAILCELGAHVYSIESVKTIGMQARSILNKLKYHALQKIGDGTYGWPEYAPFDSIIVTAGAPAVPANLLGQLKNHGRLLIPTGDRNEQMLTLYIKEDDSFRMIEIEKMKFVPLIGKHGW